MSDWSWDTRVRHDVVNCCNGKISRLFGNCLHSRRISVQQHGIFNVSRCISLRLSQTSLTLNLSLVVHFSSLRYTSYCIFTEGRKRLQPVFPAEEKFIVHLPPIFNTALNYFMFYIHKTWSWMWFSLLYVDIPLLVSLNFQSPAYKRAIPFLSLLVHHSV